MPFEAPPIKATAFEKNYSTTLRPVPRLSGKTLAEVFASASNLELGLMVPSGAGISDLGGESGYRRQGMFRRNISSSGDFFNDDKITFTFSKGMPKPEPSRLVVYGDGLVMMFGDLRQTATYVAHDGEDKLVFARGEIHVVP